MISMDPRKDISVVIPVYEAENFVSKTLATVAAQSILPLEVIVVDDGSLDNTCDVIKAFCQSNPHLNVCLLREPHRGPSAARNTGINAAKGTWIAFLDSDDLWMPEKLERMALAYQTMPESNFLCHNEIHRHLDNSEHLLDYSLGYRSDIPLQEQLFANNRFSTSAVICRRDMILSCGGFDNTYPNAQDYEMWLRMSPGIKVLFVTEVLGIYVDRTGNISSGQVWRRFKNIIRVLYRHRDKVSAPTYIKKLARLFLSYGYRASIQSFGRLSRKTPNNVKKSPIVQNDIGFLLSQITRGDDGIYGVPTVNSGQFVEMEMREKIATARHNNPLRHIAKHHSIPVMDREISRFLANIPVGGTIIDLGGCWGWHWRNLRAVRPDIKVVIVDFVRANLLHAQGILGDSINKSIFLVHCNATQLQFPSDIFDGVWTVQTFQHIPDFDRAVSEACRVLKQGGVFANYSLNVQPHIRWIYGLLGRTYLVEGWVDGMFWLSRASKKQRMCIEATFGSAVSERWTEILYSPELHFRTPGREGNLLGKFDALLSNNAGFLGWFARQRSFHCKKS